MDVSGSQLWHTAKMSVHATHSEERHHAAGAGWPGALLALGERPWRGLDALPQQRLYLVPDIGGPPKNLCISMGVPGY